MRLCFCTGLSCKLVRLSRCLPAAPPPAPPLAASAHKVELLGRICNVHSADGLNMPPVKCNSLRFCFIGRCCALATSGRRSSSSSKGCEEQRALDKRLAALLLGSELKPQLWLLLGERSVLLRRRCPAGEL